jgi:hypothetical protein
MGRIAGLVAGTALTVGSDKTQGEGNEKEKA